MIQVALSDLPAPLVHCVPAILISTVHLEWPSPFHLWVFVLIAPSAWNALALAFHLRSQLEMSLPQGVLPRPTHPKCIKYLLVTLRPGALFISCMAL